ncbi:4Fe-4S binding protein [Desulfothermus okinawensis JCM 13304]
MGDVYKKLAQVLDSMPQGFPSTPDGLEIKILKKIFEPDEAELFCKLKLKFETVDDIAKRTGMEKEFLEKKLTEMWKKGQIMGVDFGGTKLFKMMPWMVGIYEYQVNRMDEELAKLCEEFMPYIGKKLLGKSPRLMQVLPIEENLNAEQEALPFERVSEIIENGKSFGVAQCICKKEKALVGEPCDKPQEVCLAVAKIPGIIEQFDHWGRPITKEEAYNILKKAEESALVHLTFNTQDDTYFICNCCGCCCGVLRAINEVGVNEAVNSRYRAKINPDLCVGCGTCKDERCQVNAIKEEDGVYSVIEDRCIGCGLCVSTCPSDAIELIKKEDNWTPPPKDENEWLSIRAKEVGVDLSKFI